MASQGGESIPGLDPRPAEVVNVDQGHASTYSSFTPENQSWSVSAGQSIPSSVHPCDPQSQLSVSVDSQSSNYSSSHAAIPSTLGSASTMNEYSGYPSYSSSSVPYTYNSNNTDSNNYYYNYPQPVQQSSAQQVDPNPNTGAAYQPLSSFQNSGSYVGPPSYLGTYYNAGDYQTTSGYGQNNYNYQNNTRNDGNYGSYQSHHYANYAATDSAQSSTTANSLYYQQQYNQWPYYSQPAPVANGASGSGNITSSVNSLPAGYPTAGVSGGYPYVSNQPPPPGTTSWNKESGSSVPFSQGKYTSTAYPLNTYLEAGALGSQNQNTNQSSYIQTPPISSYPNEIHESEQKVFYSQAPSLQHSYSNQVPQHLHQQPHPALTTDARQVSKVHIMVNPRIAPNMGVGIPKSQKESSAANAAVKPAYLSVPLPKVDTKPASRDDAKGTAKGILPASLRAYVERAFARCKDDAERSASQNIMKEIINKATEEGTLFTTNWDTGPLFPLPTICSNTLDFDQSNSQSLASVSFLPKAKKSPGRRTKSRWEPVAEEKVGEAVPSVNIEALSKVSNFNDWNRAKFVAPQQQAPPSIISQSPRKKLRTSDSSILTSGDSLSDNNKEHGLTKPYSSPLTLASSAEERKRRENRFKRFEKGQGNKVEMNHLKSKSTEGGNVYTKRPSTMLYAKSYEDVSGVSVEDINWDSLTVKGTCQEIEKGYLRLTSAPDPETVRPEIVLEKALEMVQSSKKNYLYKCDQLKSIRQDLTVQRIQNTFTVKVYETHARFALEAGDLQEYNQCQSQLKRLYSEGIEGHHKEFSAYNLLYIILHSNNKRDLLSSMMRLSCEAKADKAVKHALAVRGAVSLGNYIHFFRLYKEAPNLNACLMDLYTENMRFEAIKCMCKAYRPVVPVPYVSCVLGFSKALESVDSNQVAIDGTEECEEWLKAHGAVVTVDSSGERQLDTKASSSTLYMPEPEDAVAHGDASLGVDDFLARAL